MHLDAWIILPDATEATTVDGTSWRRMKAGCGSAIGGIQICAKADCTALFFLYLPPCLQPPILILPPPTSHVNLDATPSLGSLRSSPAKKSPLSDAKRSTSPARFSEISSSTTTISTVRLAYVNGGEGPLLMRGAERHIVNPKKSGPFHHRAPSRILYKAVRGMVS